MATIGAKLTPSLPTVDSLSGPEGAAGAQSQVRNALRARRLMQVVVDLLSIWCGAVVAIAICFATHLLSGEALGLPVAFLLLYSGLIILFCNTQRLYSDIQLRSSRNESNAVARATVMASLLLMACIYISGIRTISRFAVALSMTLSLVAIVTSRWIRRRRLQCAPADGFTCRNVVIVGTGMSAQALHHYLQEHRYLGYVAAGFITADEDVQPLEGVLGSVRALPQIVRTHFIDEVIVATQNRAAAKLAIAEARACDVGVRVMPDLYDGIAWGAPVEYVGLFPTICLDQRRVPALALMIKRAIDVTSSAAALLMLCPLIAAIALAIRLDSAGPVFYTSDRVGRKGRIFPCHKFRTMVGNAEKLRAKLQHLNGRDKVLFKIPNDPRITRVGRFLRKYSFDELPQLWNVLKGDMSMVGPRPPLAAEVRQYELEHLRRLDVMPGITGLWQVEARGNPSFASYIALDIEYVDRWSLILDIRILLKTAAVVVAGTGQ